MADGTTVDSLQIEIEASSAEAEKKVDALAAALERLKKASTGFRNISNRIKDIGTSASEAPAAAKTRQRREALNRATETIGPSKSAGLSADKISRELSRVDKEIEKTEKKILSLQNAFESSFNPSEKGDLSQQLDQYGKLQDALDAQRRTILKSFEDVSVPSPSEMNLEKKVEALENVKERIKNSFSDGPFSTMRDEKKSSGLAYGLESLRIGFSALGNIAPTAAAKVRDAIKSIDIKSFWDQERGTANESSNLAYGLDSLRIGFVGLIDPIKNLAGLMKDKISGGFSSIKGLSLQSLIPKGAVSGVKVLEGAFGGLKDKMKSLGQTAASTAQKGLELLASSSRNLASTLKNLVTNGIEKAASGLKSLASSIGSKFTSPFKNAIGAFSKWKSAIGRVAFYRAISLAIGAVTEGLKTGMANLYQYSRLVGTEFAPAMNSLATSSQYLKNSLGAMAAPLIQALAPVVDMLTEKFVALINVIGKVFAILTGKTVYTQAKKQAVEYGEAANKAAKATKDFLLGIDELNVISKDTGGGAGGADYGSMFEEVEIPVDQFDWVQDIRDAIDEGEWRVVGELVGKKLNDIIDGWDSYAWGKKLGELINNGLNIAYGFLTTFDFEKFGSKVAGFFNGIFETVDWDLLGRTFAAGWNGLMEFIYGFITGFHWDVFGKAIADAIIGFFSEIDWELPIKILQAGIEAVRQAFVGFLSEFGERLDIQGITDPLIEIVNTVAYTLQKLIEDTKAWFVQLDFTPLITSFENLLAAISPFVSVVSEGLLWAYENVLLPFGTWTIEEALPTVVNLLATGFDFLTAVFEKLSPIAQLLWNDILNPIFNAAWDVLSTAVEAVANTFQKLTDVLNGNTSFSEFLDSLAPGEAIILGIATALGVLGTAFAIGSAISAAGALISGAITAIGAALSFLTSPIGIVIGAITALVAGFTLLYQNFEPFRDFIDGIVEGAKELVPGIIEGIQEGWNHFTEWLGGLWQSIVDGFKSFFGIHSPSTVFADLGGNLIAGLLDGISGVWGGIVEFFGGKVEALKEFFSGAWEDIKTTAGEKWENIKTDLGTAWDKITGDAKDKFEEIRKKVSEAWDNVKKDAGEKWNNIKSDLTGKFEEIRDKTKDKFEEVRQKVSDAWENVKKDVPDKWKTIKENLITKYEEIRDRTKDKFEEVRGKVSEAWDSIKNDVPGKFDSIKTAVSSAWGNIVESAKTWGSDLCSNLASGIESGIKWVKNAASSVAGAISDFLHFSEPDIGPLSNFHTYMPDMLDLMAKGIKDNSYLAINAASDLADTMSKTLGNIEPVEPKFSNLPNQGSSFSTASIQGMAGVPNYSMPSDSGAGRNDNSDLINAFYSAAGMIVEAIQNQDNGVYLDGKQLMQSVEKSQRQRGANIMGGGVLN